VRELVCAPHRVKLLGPLGVLEVTIGTINDLVPIGANALGNHTLKKRVSLGATKCDLKSSHGIERIAPPSGAEAEAIAHGVVAALGGNDHADPLPPPVANILEDSVVRRISHLMMLVCV